MTPLLIIISLLASLFGLSSALPTWSLPFYNDKLHPGTARSRNIPRKITLSHARRPISLKRDFPTDDLSILSVGAFSTVVNIGSQTFTMFVDTGSYANWLPRFNVSCYNPQAMNLSTGDPALCGYVNPLSWENEESSFLPTLFPNTTIEEPFSVGYAGGGIVTGVLGNVDMSIGGLNVPNAQLGLVETSTKRASYGADGLLGLAFSFPGGTTSLAESIFSDNLTAPLFSMALARGDVQGAYGGSMMFGAMLDPTAPDVNSTGNDLVIVEMLRCSFAGCNSDPALSYTFYAVNVTAVITNDTSETTVAVNETQQGFIMDSGTTYNYFPPDMAATVNSQMDPPAFQVNTNPTDLLWIAQCNATSARVGLQIRASIFYINPMDMISQNHQYNATHCSCATQSLSDGQTLGVLGSTFLKNVLVVFDTADHAIALQAREWYTDPEPTPFEPPLLNQSIASTVSARVLSSISSSNSAPLSPQGYKIPLRRSSTPTSRRRDLNPSVNVTANFLSFSADIIIGQQTFSLLVDTGSPATWIGTTTTSCQPWGCYFPNPLNASNEAANFHDPAAKAVSINLTYGDSTFAQGRLKTTSASLPGANFSFPMYVAVVDNTANPLIATLFDGILGLSFSELALEGTGVYFPSFPDSLFHAPQLPPNTLTASLFTLELSRDASRTGDGGNLTFGSYPDDPSNSTIWIPMQTPYDYYKVQVNGYKLGSTYTNMSLVTIIDCGTSVNLLPAEHAAALNAGWAELDHATGSQYVAPCTATGPQLSFHLGDPDQSLSMNPADAITSGMYNETHCLTAFQTAPEGLHVALLGEPFFRNVVAIFDWDREMLGFQGREEYVS